MAYDVVDVLNVKQQCIIASLWRNPNQYNCMTSYDVYYYVTNVQWNSPYVELEMHHNKGVNLSDRTPTPKQTPIQNQ